LTPSAWKAALARKSAGEGLDETLTPDALKVDFRRPQKHNPIFNVGPHHCPGANLARIELRTFFEEWLKRIPHFRLQPGVEIPILTGNSMGPATMPIEWDVA
jgi:cytochrome P450